MSRLGRLATQMTGSSAAKGAEAQQCLCLAFSPPSHPVLRFEQQEPDTLSPGPSQHAPSSSTHLSSEPYRDVSPPPSSPKQDHAELFESQKRMFASQDNQLDTLTLSIGRQRDLSLRMNEELELQGELLEELDGDVERTGLRLGRASGQLERVRRGVSEHGE